MSIFIESEKENMPIPLRPYPGIRDAFGDLIESMTQVLSSERTNDVKNWVDREMHAATSADIVALLDAATQHILEGTEDTEKNVVSLRLDHLRREISQRVSFDSIQKKDVADEIITGILGIIALLDADLYDHLDAVGILSCRIALAMGYDQDFAKTCCIVGRLHDIGKMAVPHAILYKPGPLDFDEFEIMKQHVEASTRMVLGIPGLMKYAPFVRAHHERLDGSGYPQKLFGSDIPMEARIVAVADVFHAMTSNRCYRAPLEPHVALQEISDGKGRLYDIDVVNVTLRIFHARPDTFVFS